MRQIHSTKNQGKGFAFGSPMIRLWVGRERVILMKDLPGEKSLGYLIIGDMKYSKHPGGLICFGTGRHKGLRPRHNVYNKERFMNRGVFDR